VAYGPSKNSFNILVYETPHSLGIISIDPPWSGYGYILWTSSAVRKITQKKLAEPLVFFAGRFSPPRSLCTGSVRIFSGTQDYEQSLFLFRDSQWKEHASDLEIACGMETWRAWWAASAASYSGTRYNEVPKDWENNGASLYQVVFHTFYYYWADKHRLLYQGVRYIGFPLYVCACSSVLFVRLSLSGKSPLVVYWNHTFNVQLE